LRKESWRWLFVSFVFILGLILFVLVKPVLGPFLLAFALAYLLSPVVESLEKRGIGRRWAIAWVFSGIIFLLGSTLFLILPSLYSELSKLALILPTTMHSLDQSIQSFRANFRSSGLPNQVAQVLDGHLGRGEVFLAERLQAFLQTLPEMLASLSMFVLSPVLAIYFLADWKRLNQGCLRLVPQKWRLEWQRLLQDINHVVRRFVRGDLIVAVIVGILTGIGVKIIGMDYALLIGLICGVFDLIPYFGPVIGAVPSVLLGLTKSPVMGLKIAIVIIIVQQLESDLISPKLMGDSVGLHPLLIVFVLLAGGELVGFWGMLLSVPFAAVLRVILRHIYFRLVSPELQSQEEELKVAPSVDKLP